MSRHGQINFLWAHWGRGTLPRKYLARDFLKEWGRRKGWVIGSYLWQQMWPHLLRSPSPPPGLHHQSLHTQPNTQTQAYTCGHLRKNRKEEILSMYSITKFQKAKPANKYHQGQIWLYQQKTSLMKPENSQATSAMISSFLSWNTSTPPTYTLFLPKLQLL